MTGIKKLFPNHLRLADSDITVTTGGAPGYAVGTVIGGLLTFPLPRAGLGGKIHQVDIVDQDNVKEAFTLWLFDAQPSAQTDTAAFAPTVDDLKKIITSIPVVGGDYTTFGTAAIGLTSLTDPRIFYASGAALYGYIVADAIASFTTADALQQINLEVETDVRSS